MTPETVGAAVGRGGRLDAPLLVFVHIPKTAGTTVRAILRMNEPGELVQPLFNVFKGGGGFQRGLMERLRDGKRLPDLDEARALTGHFPLGVREYLPRYVPPGREVRYFTFLREPIDRSLSHYFRVRAIRRTPPGTTVPRSRLSAEPTLDELLEGGYIHDNLQTRMLSGLPVPLGEVSDGMLEQAKRNLREGLAFFGIAERFDESLLLAKQRLGLSSILNWSAGSRAERSLSKAAGRVNSARPRGEEVPAELVRAAERCNRYDIELYRYARELFDGAPELRELEFGVELAALRAARAEGEIPVDVPAPEGFAGSEHEWHMLLHASATLLRRDVEVLEVKASTQELARRFERVLKELQEIRKAQAVPAVRNPDAPPGMGKGDRPMKVRRRQRPSGVGRGSKAGKRRRFGED